MKKVSVIGSGFSGLAAAASLAQKGFDVHVFEKNADLGGRARKFEADGFTFDMGPSWYWMPEVFESFYKKFGHTTSDFYQLDRLDPSYRIIFSDGEIDVPAAMEELEKMFEGLEPGSSKPLKKFLAEAKYKYEVGMEEFVWKPSLSILEFIDLRIFKSALKLDMFTSISSQVRKLFKNPKLRSLLEFPVLFLGAKPQQTPALYSLMNYADLSLGTWYPQGGMYGIIEAMVQICKEQNVQFHCDSPVQKIYEDGDQLFMDINDEKKGFDYIVASADYHHVESKLLEEENRNYSDNYWERRTMAPSSLLYYIGVDKKLDGLKHHNLFFDADFDVHSDEIYNTKEWPSDPLFYVCCPSRSDASVAPEGKENVFLLIPIAAGLDNNELEKKRLYRDVMDRLEKYLGEEVRESIVYQRSFCVDEFIGEYNSFKGNAYGLANTLKQTAILKPRIQNRRLTNLYYTGQLTTPGPGVPPSIISGQVVAQQIISKELKKG